MSLDCSDGNRINVIQNCLEESKELTRGIQFQIAAQRNNDT